MTQDNPTELINDIDGNYFVKELQWEKNSILNTELDKLGNGGKH